MKKWGSFSFLWVLLLIFILGSELFIVQELTLKATHSITWHHRLASPLIRGFLDLLFVSIIVLGFSRKFFYLFSVCEFGILSSLLIYYSYFGKPLSFNTILMQFHEGLSVAPFIFELIDGKVILVLGSSFILKILLREKIERRNIKITKNSKSLSCIISLAYLSSIAISGTFIDPLINIRNHAYLGSLGMTYGYFWTWCAELYFLNDKIILQHSLDIAKNRTARPFPKSVGKFTLNRKIVIIQVESLDYELLSETFERQYITPFIKNLINHSKVFRIRPIHINGSGDSDFVTLMGVMPSLEVINYKITGFPFTKGSLPDLLSKYNFTTYAFHGATGDFFGRRNSYAKMGFNDVYFREELESITDVSSNDWGIKDNEVFQFSSNIINKSDQNTCHFIITLTSHGPYSFLNESEKELFKKPTNLKMNYLNSMRYVDNALENYVNSLPDNTSVIIYGDHGANEIFKRNGNNDANEFVPFILHNTGSIDFDGELFEFSEYDLLDAITYFREQLKAFK